MTKPSVRQEIQRKIEIEKPHVVYKNLVCENVEGHDAVSKPRNIKQLHNAKVSKQEDLRLTRDAIYNTHELAYEGGFIHFLSTYPDLCVVAGEMEMIEELNPLVAGLFLIHERKLTETHDQFFKSLASLVKHLNGVPIVTDMEAAIVKAIRENTMMKQIGCWRHLRQDIQRWLTDNLPKVERASYVNDLYAILRSTTERQCSDLIVQYKRQWDEDYVRYFKKAVEPKLGYFCAWSISDFCKFDPNNGITTNQSEGFNFLLKDFQNWKEVPLDSLLMSLKLIQGFYLEEIRRGKARLGTFRLKKKYARFATNVIEFQSRKLLCHPKDIVSSLRDRSLKTDYDGEIPIELPKSEDSDNSRILRAKLLASSDSIAFSAKLGVFIISDQTSIYTVRLYPTESCSCPVKKNCVHILGVKLGQRMNVTDDDLAVQKNVAVVRKNVRFPVKQKPGRKRPRPGDISVEIPHKIQLTKEKLEEAVKELEESMKDRSLDDLIDLEDEVKHELKIEQQIETEHFISENSIHPEIQNHHATMNADEPEFSYINLITSTPKSPELLKDIRYSLEVWVSADKEKLFHNLNVNDRKLLQTRTGWMNDTIIDSAMNLLQFQFPDLEGFQSTTLAVQLDFNRHEKLFIQIINRSPDTKVSHWLTVSNINCLKNEICIYDSSFDDLPHIEQMVVASLVKTDEHILKVKFSNVFMQTNGNDCGLYAIANATALAFGKDPAKEQYIPNQMRDHLMKCLEEKYMKLFPTAKATSKRRKAIKKKQRSSYSVFVKCQTLVQIISSAISVRMTTI